MSPPTCGAKSMEQELGAVDVPYLIVHENRFVGICTKNETNQNHAWDQRDEKNRREQALHRADTQSKERVVHDRYLGEL